MGRPPFNWTPEVEEEVFRNIAEGKSIRSALEDDWLPSWTTFNKRLQSDPSFASRYTQAREEQADKLFEECLEIADQYDRAAEKMEGGTDHINRARLRIDTRKWMAGKLRPKVYGDKLDVAVSKQATEDELDAAIAAKLAAMAGVGQGGASEPSDG